MAKHILCALGTALIFGLLLPAPPAGAQTPANVKVNTLSNWPEETAIGINPVDPQNILGVAQSPCRTYVSSDGGISWIEGQLPDVTDLGDPSIVFDRAGTAYYCYIGLYEHPGIFVNRSTDGGRTWRPQGTALIEHTTTAPFEDKSYPVCDWTTGSHAGSIYVAWTQFDHLNSSAPADSSRILFARSTDGGFTFSPPVKVSDKGGDAIDSDGTVEGAVPAVGTDGTVYLAWAGPRGLEFDRSTDGGATFGKDRVISDIPGGWDFPVTGLYRCNGLPTTKVCLASGLFYGRIFVCWSDQRYGDTDVFLIHSDDGGATWSARVRVNSDPMSDGRDQFFPWIDVDAVTGKVYIVYYDRRGPSDPSTDVVLAVSADGGDTFASQVISTSPFVANDQVFFGDYIGLAALGDRVRPLWMRMDNSTLSLWTALIDAPVTGTPEAVWVTPNPTRDEASIHFGSSANLPSSLVILDAGGRLIWLSPLREGAGSDRQVIWNGRDTRGRKAGSGVYFLQGGGRYLGRLVLIR